MLDALLLMPLMTNSHSVESHVSGRPVLAFQPPCALMVPPEAGIELAARAGELARARAHAAIAEPLRPVKRNALGPLASNRLRNTLPPPGYAGTLRWRDYVIELLTPAYCLRW